MNKDTITALSTAPYKSAIAIIRISGENSISLLNLLLDKPLKENNKLYKRTLATKNITDEVMAVYFNAPKSYTGENMAEIYCHGNMLICDEIIAELIRRGARVAKAGEFTMRAIKNNKTDLLKSEALIDLLNAETIEQINYSNERLKGELFIDIKNIEQELLRLLSTVEAVINYPDEFELQEIRQLLENDVYKNLEILNKKTKKILENYDGNRIINEGCKIAVIGKANAGKSTLFNALLGYERAIVTEFEGTTRDTVDDFYIYNNRKFILTDTAGIRQTQIEAEKLGIERSYNAVKKSDIVLFIKTTSDETTDIKHNKIIEILNKCDDCTDLGADYQKAILNGPLMISAKYNKNIRALKQMIYDYSNEGTAHSGICNARHYECILRCNNAVKKAADLKAESELELISALIYEASGSLADLFGTNVNEKVLDNVFSRFCVGK